jgi:hypothetical protein
MTLASLYLTTFMDKHGLRAWKSHRWDVVDRLDESGYIQEPRDEGEVGDADRGRGRAVQPPV